MTTLDKCHRLLQMMGFSVGEAAFDLPDGRREWQVDASRDGHTVLAKAPTQQGAWESVTRMVGRLIRRGVLLIAILLVAGCGPSASQHVEDLVTRGILLHHQDGETAAAIECFTRALEIDPRSADAHIWRAVAYDALGKESLKKADLNKALTLLGEAIKQNPREPRWYITRVQVHTIEGDMVAATADCNRAIEVAPNDPGPYEGRAAIHILRGDLDKALADLTEAIRLGPYNSEYYLARSNVWQRMGKTEEAEADIARANEVGAQMIGEPLDPNEWRARH